MNNALVDDVKKFETQKKVSFFFGCSILLKCYQYERRLLSSFFRLKKFPQAPDRGPCCIPFRFQKKKHFLEFRVFEGHPTRDRNSKLT